MVKENRFQLWSLLFTYRNYYEKNNNKDDIIITNYAIPSNWTWSRLKNLVMIINGFTPSRTNTDYWNGGTLSWMTVEDLNEQGKFFYRTNQHINEEKLKCSNRIVPEDSTFICCTSATIGKVAINKIKTTSNQQFNGLVIKNQDILTNEYLYYFCLTLKPKLLEIAGVTTFPFVSTSKLGELLFPLPPINEQIRIISKLKLLEKNLENII